MGKLKQKLMEEQDRIDYHVGQVSLFGDFHDIGSFYTLVVDAVVSEGIRMHTEHVNYLTQLIKELYYDCLLYTSPSPRDS